MNAPDLLNVADANGAFRSWVREQILAAAREHVLGHRTIAAALNEANVAVEVEAFELLAAMLGKTVLTPAQRRAIERAVVAEARAQAENILNDEESDSEEAWGTKRMALEQALDRNSDYIASCDSCDGRGHDEDGDRCCFGGLCVAPENVTALAIKLRDEAIAALWTETPAQREAPALVPVDVPNPIAEVA